MTAASLLLCLTLPAKTIKGTVTDASTGEQIIGATVMIKGGKQGVATGLDGRFVLKQANDRCILVCSYVGYKQQEIRVDNEEKEISVRLEGASTELHAVEVVAHADKTSDNSARRSEQLSNNVLNVVGARAIELSPDMTVANVVQRVSGVTVERNSSGDGQYAILRGMDKRYNYTLVNDIKIPSPDNKNRFVPLDIFPAELLDRLEVTKSLTPEMEGDAIGGAVNLVMKEAPSSMRVTANLATGYNSLFFDHSFQTYDAAHLLQISPYEKYGPTYPAKAKDFPVATVDLQSKTALPNLFGGFSAGNRFLHQKLGLIVAGSFQNNYRGNNSLYFSSETASSDASNLPVLKDMRNRRYSEQQTRYGLHAKIDFRLSNRHRFELYSAYMSLANTQVRDEKNVDLVIGYNPSTGDYNVAYDTRFRKNSQTIFSNMLHGEHSLIGDKLKIDWKAVYSKAGNKTPDNTTVHTQSTVRGGEEKLISVNTFDGEDRRWEHNNDEDRAGYLKASIAPSAFVTLTTGGLYRDKERSNFFNQYTFTPYSQQTGSNNLIKGTDWNDYTQIQFVIKNPYGSVGDPLNYDASEKIGAGFFQVVYERNKWKITGGVRLEHTDQGYHLIHAVDGVKNIGNQVYNDWLPSLHLKYSPWKNHNFRLSYFRSLNRPSFFEIVPYNIVNEDYTEKGNPDLKHTVADNIDFRYEFFPRPAEQLMAGLFYKRIANPIEYGMTTQGQGTFFMPENFGTATNYGIEIDAVKYFSSFGFKANYTYTHSAITTTKLFNYTDANSGSSANILTKNIEQTRPLYGQSPSVANLSLLYKDGKRGWDAQLTGAYTGERLYAVSRYYNNDQWQKESIQLDASVEKKCGKTFSFFAKAGNLLNSPMIVYLKQVNSANDKVTELQLCNGGTLVRKDRYGVQFQMGFRLRFE
jgi:TonB-dependent receptor